MTDVLEALFELVEEEETAFIAAALLGQTVPFVHSKRMGGEALPQGEASAGQVSGETVQESSGLAILEALLPPDSVAAEGTAVQAQMRAAGRLWNGMRTPVYGQMAGLNRGAQGEGRTVSRGEAVQTPVGVDPRGVDRAFQRDSRRYDNGFTFY